MLRAHTQTQTNIVTGATRNPDPVLFFLLMASVLYEAHRHTFLLFTETQGTAAQTGWARI